MINRSYLMAAVAAAPLLWASSALAQYESAPFLDHTVAVSQAYGFESIRTRLDMAENISAPYAEGFIEKIEGLKGPLYEHFEGTLEAKDNDLAKAFSRSLKAIIATVKENGDPKQGVADARALLDRAYATVIPEDVRNNVAFKGGVIQNLLLADDGVAEGYEEAIEEGNPWEYVAGWAALQRVKVLWADVKDGGSAERQADAQQMLDFLDTLYPQAQPPENFNGKSAEEAESPAQRLGGILEEVVKADLYPGRDLPKLAGHLAEVVAAACPVFPQDDEVAAESIYAAYALFGEHLEKTAGMFAPVAVEAATEAFEAMIEVDDDDDDDKGAAQAAEQDDDDDDMSEEEACGVLTNALKDIKTALGG